MADSKDELIQEARVLTGYSELAIPKSEFNELVSIAQRDIRSEYSSDLEFFAGELSNDDALFWLVCLFSKVAAGEIGGIEITLSEVRTKQPSNDAAFRFWQNKLNAKLSNLNDGGIAGSHRNSARQDRSYGYENA